MAIPASTSSTIHMNFDINDNGKNHNIERNNNKLITKIEIGGKSYNVSYTMKKEDLGKSDKEIQGIALKVFPELKKQAEIFANMNSMYKGGAEAKLTANLKNHTITYKSKDQTLVLDEKTDLSKIDTVKDNDALVKKINEFIKPIIGPATTSSPSILPGTVVISPVEQPKPSLADPSSPSPALPPTPHPPSNESIHTVLLPPPPPPVNLASLQPSVSLLPSAAQFATISAPENSQRPPEICSPHANLRQIPKRVSNSCFINTTLQIAAHFSEIGNLFLKEPKQRAGESKADYDKRVKVQKLGKEVIEYILAGNEKIENNNKITGENYRNNIDNSRKDCIKNFFEALATCTYRSIGSIELGGDPAVLLLAIIDVLRDESEIGPYGNVQALDLKQLKNKEVGSKSNEFICIDINDRDKLEEEIKIGNDTYQLEVVMFGTKGHTYPCIRYEKDFVKYDDLSGIKKMSFNDIYYIRNGDSRGVPVRYCYYVKKPKPKTT